MELEALINQAESKIINAENVIVEQLRPEFDSLEEFEICAEIARSGYFDETYYLAKSPDVAATDLDPLTHYIRYGESEGRKPCKSIDPEELRKKFDSGQCLLLQFIRSL